MAKAKVTYKCMECEAVSAMYLGKCPDCGAWGSFVEEVALPAMAGAAALGAHPGLDDDGAAGWGWSSRAGGRSGPVVAETPLALYEISEQSADRISTGLSELDRTLGGGVVPGAYVLLGGDPGIGKSTIMLQVAQHLGRVGKKVFYVAGEESPQQLKLRAKRLGIAGDGLHVVASTELNKLVETIRTHTPDWVVVDSIQSLYDHSHSGAPGSIGQMKACACTLMEVAKALNVTIFLIGHVTKTGEVSGPKLLEHTVDAVLYLEGDKDTDLRLVRTVKNRFGPTQEVGVFEMTETGLQPLENPSGLFLTPWQEAGSLLPGMAIVPTLQGSRAMMAEIQALTGYSTYAAPRRVANGVDSNRLNQIVAVLERRLGLDFSRQDVYVSVVGGLRVQEPAADLGIALAIVSSMQNVPLKSGLAVCGEISLAGQVRPVARAELRCLEAERLGLTTVVMPALKGRKANTDDGDESDDGKSGITKCLVATLREALPLSLAGVIGQGAQAHSAPIEASADWARLP
jgi:DNA repair protein RadA/Sms